MPRAIGARARQLPFRDLDRWGGRTACRRAPAAGSPGRRGARHIRVDIFSPGRAPGFWHRDWHLAVAEAPGSGLPVRPTLAPRKWRGPNYFWARWPDRAWPQPDSVALPAVRRTATHGPPPPPQPAPSGRPG